jgi:hypothetical protein
MRGVRSLAYMSSSSSSSLACMGWGSLHVFSARVLLFFYMLAWLHGNCEDPEGL